MAFQIFATDPEPAKVEGESVKLDRRSGRRWPIAAIAVGWWLVTALVYHGTAENFLRAESGWYLMIANSEPALQRQVLRGFFTGAFNGHYTPIANAAELVTAKFVGTRAHFWKWRAIMLVALLGATFFVVAREVADAFGLRSSNCQLSAAALAAVLIFEAPMRELVGWPFMSLQLWWLIFTTGALLCVVRFARQPDQPRWLWSGAAAAYAALHCLGLGIATVAATLVALSAVRLANQNSRALPWRKVITPLGCLLLVAMIHGILMVRLLVPAADPSATAKRLNVAFFTDALGFVARLFLRTIEGMLSAGQPSGSAVFRYDWTLGLALLAGFLALVLASFRRAVTNPGMTNTLRLALKAYGCVSFVAITAMVIFREQHGGWTAGFGYYLASGRYLVPAAFGLLAVSLSFLLAPTRRPRVAAVSRLGLATVVIAANIYYAAKVQPQVAPRTVIAHGKAWRSIVSMARECLAAGVPIPNLPISDLTDLDGSELKEFEPLLRADLQLPASVTLPFAPMQDVRQDADAAYLTKVPKLRAVQKLVPE